MTTMTLRKTIPQTVVMLALLLGIVPNGTAQTAERPGGPQKGIEVHGHWVVEVRNIDGTLAERREFENDLFGGSRILAQLLSGAISVGNKWAVALGTFPFGNPGPCGATNNKDCVIFEGTPSVLKPNVEIAGTNLV